MAAKTNEARLEGRIAFGAPLRVGFVGAGKVGCSLARYLQVDDTVGRASFYSRSAEHAREAAGFCDGRAYGSLAELAEFDQLIFLTVPDGAIARVADELAACGVGLTGKIVAHCSGAIASDALAACRGAGACVASMHPLYAVSSRFNCWRELGRAWFSLEGDEVAVRTLEALLDRLGNGHARIDASDKPRYHAAAVMASNLVVGLYDMAAGELARCGIDRDEAESALAALFLGNARHVAADGVGPSLTGPAARGDEATIARHLDVLADNPEVASAYRVLTERCRQIAARKR